MVSVESALLGVLLGLYLIDCFILLEPGQAILERRRSGWRLVFGNRHYVVRGKPVAMLNPLMPWTVSFKTLRLFEKPSSAALKPSAGLRAMPPLQLSVLIQFIGVLVALPITLVYFPGWPLLAVLAMVYCNVLVMIAALYYRFGRIRLPKRPLLSLAFTCLVCLPLSVNLYRRAGLLLPLSGDASRFLRMLSTGSRSTARQELLRHVEEALLDADDSGPHFQALTSLQNALAVQGGDG